MSVSVTFFLKEGFGGDSKTFEGVGSVRDLRSWDHAFWVRIKSIKVSEDAVCRAFSETDFRHDEMTCLPGEERDRLDSNEFKNRIKSFKVYDATRLQPPY